MDTPYLIRAPLAGQRVKPSGLAWRAATPLSAMSIGPSGTAEPTGSANIDSPAPVNVDFTLASV